MDTNKLTAPRYPHSECWWFRLPLKGDHGHRWRWSPQSVATTPTRSLIPHSRVTLGVLSRKRSTLSHHPWQSRKEPNHPSKELWRATLAHFRFRGGWDFYKAMKQKKKKKKRRKLHENWKNTGQKIIQQQWNTVLAQSHMEWCHCPSAVDWRSV